jgi:uncharacterized protein
MTQPPAFSWANVGEWLHALADWALALGRPLAVGLLMLALGLAALGWSAVQILWRAWVIVQWRRRRRRRGEA